MDSDFTTQSPVTLNVASGSSFVLSLWRRYKEGTVPRLPMLCNAWPRLPPLSRLSSRTEGNLTYFGENAAKGKFSPW